MKLVAPPCCIDADETPLLFCEKRFLFPTVPLLLFLVFVASLLLLLSLFVCAEINHRAVSPSATVSFSFSESCNAKKSSLEEDDDEEAKQSLDASSARL